MPLRLRHVLLLACTLALPACGSSTPTNPGALRAIITVAVDPSPVPPSQNPLTGAVSVGFKVVISELNGLGGDVQFVNSQIFDPETGQQVAISYFDSSDLVVFVGTKRLEPNGTLTVPQSASYVLPNYRVPAQMTVSVQVKDDKGSLLNQSVLVKIEYPASS
jgi:hypothetical protein